MKTPNHEIVVKIKLRQDQYQNGLVSLYWGECQSDGRTRRGFFYWGALPTKKLKILLDLIANPGRNERKRICRMLGLKMSDVPKEKLRDSEFLKTQILNRLKEKEQKTKNPFLFTPTQMRELKCVEREVRKNMTKALESAIQGANSLRSCGEVIMRMTGHERWIEGDWSKHRFFEFEGLTPEFCQVAMSTWRNHPKPIWQYEVAMAILKSAKLLA